MDKHQWIKLAISIAICQLAGIIGSVFTANSVGTWYKTLIKPIFNPPSWIFGPVWIILFVLMGISLYLVWNAKTKDKKTKRTAIAVFGIQLFLNILWSLFFFGLQQPYYAFVEIIFLWVGILASMILFYRISKTAAYLLIPYILWVSFAIVLNYYLWILN